MSKEKGYSLPGYRHPYLTCRTFGHSWAITRSGDDANNPSTVMLVLTCRSCATKRTDIVSRSTGSLASRRYDYPDDYRHQGKTARVEYRIEFIRRVVPLEG